MILDLGKVDMLANPSSSSKGDSRYIYHPWLKVDKHSHRRLQEAAPTGIKGFVNILQCLISVAHMSYALVCLSPVVEAGRGL